MGDDMWIAFLLVYVLNVVDLYFTKYWVKIYGIDVEANPIGRFMFNNGIVDFIKIFVIGFLLLYLYSKYLEDYNILVKVLIIFLLFCFIVLTAYHIIIYFRIR